MKLLLINDGKCIINADDIVSALVECDPRMKLENNKIVSCGTYMISANTKIGNKIIIADNMTEADAKTRLRKIGNYLTTDASFLIDFNEE